MSEEFGPPPAGIGRSQSDDDEEAIVEEFATPGDSEGLEPAAVSGTPDALAGVPAGLLDVKGVIEDQLAQAASRAAGALNAESFADTGNIQGVGIGLGAAAGELEGRGEPGSPVLTVYVAERTSSDQIRAVVAASAGPQASAVDEVPIQVVETGIIDAQPHRFRLRPAPGGISVAHFKVTAGTIGCLSRGRSAPRNARLMVLSNNHVLANSNGAVFGDCVCQPGPFDGGSCPADQIAILERFVPINFSGACNYVDCATAWCWPDRVRRELVYLSGGSPSYFRIGSTPIAPVLGCPVGKSGRTTQLTSGRITAIGVTVNVNYGAGRIARFCDQMAIRADSGAFSAGGDLRLVDLDVGRGAATARPALRRRRRHDVRQPDGPGGQRPRHQPLHLTPGPRPSSIVDVSRRRRCRSPTSRPDGPRSPTGHGRRPMHRAGRPRWRCCRSCPARCQRLPRRRSPGAAVRGGPGPCRSPPHRPGPEAGPGRSRQRPLRAHHAWRTPPDSRTHLPRIKCMRIGSRLTLRSVIGRLRTPLRSASPRSSATAAAAGTVAFSIDWAPSPVRHRRGVAAHAVEHTDRLEISATLPQLEPQDVVGVYELDEIATSMGPGGYAEAG